MAKCDGIKGQELLDFEETKNELTLIFKDNRYLFVKVQSGRLVIDPAKLDGVKGQELLEVEETGKELKLIFRDNRNLDIKVQNGQLIIDSVPE